MKSPPSVAGAARRAAGVAGVIAAYINTRPEGPCLLLIGARSEAAKLQQVQDRTDRTGQCRQNPRNTADRESNGRTLHLPPGPDRAGHCHLAAPGPVAGLLHYRYFHALGGPRCVLS